MIIDSHVHVLKRAYFDKELFEGMGLPYPEDTPIESLVSWLKEAGVGKAVIMGQDMSRIYNSSCGEEYVLECLQKYPDIFTALASVEPVDRYGFFNKDAFDYFEKTVNENGFKGLLLTPPYGQYSSDDPAVYPFYEKAVELDVVIQFHHCAQFGPIGLAPFKYVSPVSLNNVMLNFPDLKIVVEHINYPWYEELFFMMANNPNVYADLAMNYFQPINLTWNLIKAKSFGVIDRIMYGSDYWVSGSGIFSKNPANEMKGWIELIRVGLNQIAAKSGWPTLTSDEIDGILYMNASRLYNLDIKS